MRAGCVAHPLQVWFAYTGLKSYGARGVGHASDGVDLVALAQNIKHRTLSKGQGFGLNDTTPLNEHYNPYTGQPLGAQHFSWTAAHSLLWAREEFLSSLDQIR